MSKINRRNVLKMNHAVRNGQLPAARKLEEGYVSLRIPEKDYQLLRRQYPDLESHDHEIRLKAWKWLEASPLGDLYRVTERSPLQVQRAARHGNQGIIVK